MSQNLPETSSSRFQIIFNAALEEYKKRTKSDLTVHPLIDQLQLCSSPGVVLAVLQDQVRELDRSRSNDERLVRWLGPTVNVLYAFSAALGGGVGLVFSPANMIFAGIGVLLSAARDVRTSQEALIDIFERIECFLKRLEIYCGVTPTEAMADIIMKIMVEVLCILAIATKGIKERKMKKFLKKLAGRSDIEDALRRLDTLTQEEVRMATAQILIATHVVGDGVKAVHEDGREIRRIVEKTAMDVEATKHNEIREKLRIWLSPPDPSTNHNIACGTQHRGTAAWFLEGDIFKQWKSTSSLLWIPGKPGSGKSILCSAIIQHITALCEKGSASMAYFYLDFKDTDKQKLSSMLPSLLTQLAARSDSCCDVLFRLYSEQGYGAQKPGDDILMQCLKEMLTLIGHCPTYIIMDALDECPNTSGIPSAREQVLQFLKNLVHLRLPNVHICVTSRPEFDIRTALEPLASWAVSLHDQSGQRQDIVEYVKSTVYSDPMMARWREEDKELVINTLTEKADGMFRWVFCQLEVLRHCLPPSVRRTLNGLPESLDETYERILKEIKKPNKEHAYRLLQCLTVAIRPFSVEELGEVLAVGLDEGGGIPKLNPDWRWEDQEQAVLSACSTLITIVDYSDCRIVQFSHFSVKEYLTSDRLAKSSGDVSGHFRLESAHGTLARACLGVIFGLDEQVDGFSIGQLPLAEYSAQYWTDHARLSDMSIPLQEAMIHLFDPQKRYLPLWVRVHDRDKDYWPLRSWAPPPLPDAPAAALYYAALCGLCVLVDYLLTKYPQHVHTVGGAHGTALHAASRGNHSKTAQAIVERGGDVNVRSLCGKTPLHVASSAGHLDTVQWLLCHGADVNAQDDEYRNPLHLVAHETCLGVDQSPSQSRLGPLSLRSSSGSPADLGSRQREQLVEVARFLLKHGAEVDAKDRTGWTVREVASRRGYDDIIELLSDFSHGAHLSEFTYYQVKPGFSSKY